MDMFPELFFQDLERKVRGDGNGGQHSKHEKEDELLLQDNIFAFQYSHVEHSDNFILEVPYGFVSSDIPVIHDVGPLNPGQSLLENLFLDLLV